MKIFMNEQAREIATLKKIEKQIERRERIHHLLIAGLATLLAASVALHLVPCKKHGIFSRK